MANTPVIFTFNTTELPSSDITVTLTGLKPADVAYQPLKFAGKDANGNPKYTLSANAKSYTLNLVAADVDTDFNVKLEAYHFVTAQASAKRDRMNFSNLTLPKTQVGTNVVNFKFTYATNSVVPVSIKLTNLASNDGHLVDADNDGVFVFTPTPNQKTQTISLKTDSWGSKIGVKIVAAEGYNVPVSVTANRTLTSKVSYSGNLKNTIKVSYSFDSSLTEELGSLYFLWNNKTADITIEEDLGDASREVYFWYTVRKSGKRTTYLATTNLAYLADGPVTLDFQPQQ